MNHKIAIFFLIFFISGCSAFGQMPPSIVKQVLSELSTYSYSKHFDSLRTNMGSSRKVLATEQQSDDHDACRNYIYRTLMAHLGSENVYLHTFNSGDKRGLANVIGYKRGKNQQEGIWIIGAHYDSNSREENEPAPGANDNGSGVAALLEIARIVGQVETTASILFAAWDMEEFFSNGFPTGSNQWYRTYVSRKDTTHWLQIGQGGTINKEDLVLNLNFDMIGNPQNVEKGKKVLWLFSGNKKHHPFLENYCSVFSFFTPEIMTVVKGKLHLSDHYTFAARNIPAIEHLESGYNEDPFYHTSNDTYMNPQNIDFDFATQVTQGGLAYLLSTIGYSEVYQIDHSRHELVVVEQLNAYTISQPNLLQCTLLNSYGVPSTVKNQTIEPAEPGLYYFVAIDRDGRGFRKKEVLKQKRAFASPSIWISYQVPK